MQTATSGIKQELLTNRFMLQAVLERPFGAEATMLKQDLLKEGIETIGLIATIKHDLETLISATDFNESNEKEAKITDAIRMVYTMIEEDRVDELAQAFKTQFPEYYL